VRPTDSSLSCSPRIVGPDDTLDLQMSLPHGRSLHVGGPDQTPYIVVFHGEGSADRGARRSLVAPDSFARLTRLRLPVRATTAGVWVAGRDTNEALFRAPGVYRVRVGDDMETDGPRYAECLVEFRP
jgi:hypothetical protein